VLIDIPQNGAKVATWWLHGIEANNGKTQENGHTGYSASD
jgi:hypothetical protein